MRTGGISLCRFLLDLKGELGIDVPAIIARTMRELGVTALRTTNIMNRLERQMSPALALAGFAVFLDGKHDNS